MGIWVETNNTNDKKFYQLMSLFAITLSSYNVSSQDDISKIEQTKTLIDKKLKDTHYLVKKMKGY